MFKIYPLEIGNVKECMIEINVKKGFVLAKFYVVAEEEADEHDTENRYHRVPFFTKELKQTEHPQYDFIDWVNLFYQLCEEEQKH